MKVRFYCDVWPGQDITRFPLFAQTATVIKSEGCKRLSFDVSIPDEWIFGTSVHSPELIEAKENE